MERPENCQLNWSTLHDAGGNLSIEFSTGRPRHIVVIPREVLDDGLRLSSGKTRDNTDKHSKEVEVAVENAFARGDWQELVRIDDGSKLHQLWITRQDFGVV